MEHFTYDEFDSPDLPGSGRRQMDSNVLERLDLARSMAGIPFVITSGYRTRSHNAKVGGSINSSHMKGLAVDIACIGSNDRYKIVHALILVGCERIGIGKTFIHADWDMEKPRMLMWDYYE